MKLKISACDPAQAIAAVLADRLSLLARRGIGLGVWIEATVPAEIGIDRPRFETLLRRLIDELLLDPDCTAVQIRLTADPAEVEAGLDPWHRLTVSVSGDHATPRPMPEDIAALAAELTAVLEAADAGMSGRAGWGVGFWVSLVAEVVTTGSEEGIAALIATDVLDQMRRDIGATLLAELLQAFGRDIDVRCAAIAAADTTGDLSDAVRHCHAIAGASMTFGALALAEAATGAQAAYRAGDRVAAQALVKRTERLGRRTVMRVRTLDLSAGGGV